MVRTFLEDTPPVLVDWMPWNHTFGGNADCNMVLANGGTLYIDEGKPAPGTLLRLLPIGQSEGKTKYEIRVKGPNVTPGYWKRDDLTREAFDEEGFYKIGDAVCFADESDYARGIEFAGRVSEEFKLSSGTWVHTGALRVKALAALAPIAQDIVVTGHDADFIGFLIFPNLPACRSLASGLPADAPVDKPLASEVLPHGALAPEVLPERVLAHEAVKVLVHKGLRALRGEGGGSSTYAARALFLAEPPNIDAGEITDKGYINQRAVLARRATEVTRLHAAAADA